MNGKNGMAMAGVVVAMALAGCAAPVSDEGAPADENVASSAEAYTKTADTWALDWHGGTGGSGSQQTCDSGEVGVGITWAYNADYVHDLGLICARLLVDGTWTGAHKIHYLQYPSGMAEVTFQCEQGSLLTGFLGQSATYLDAIGGTCTTIAAPHTITKRWKFGGPGGRTFYDDCPTGYAISRITMRKGSWVDGFRGWCSYIQP